ncbi:MAG: helix-turn-helix domain-containing protein, partial [Candidatus Thorarchaeota archaeon]
DPSRNSISGCEELKLKTKSERLGYVLRGKNRSEIFKVLLGGCQPPSHISEKTGIPVSNVSRVLKQLQAHGLLAKLTSSQESLSLYELTATGLEIKAEFLELWSFRQSIRGINKMEE